MNTLFKASDGIDRIREKLVNRQKDLDGLKAFASVQQLTPLRTDIKELESRLKQLQKPRSPKPSSRSFTPSRLRKQLKEKESTLTLLKQMGENTKEVEKEINSITRKLSASSPASSSPKFSATRLMKQLKEKEATLTLLQQMGENTTGLDTEILDIRHKLSAKAAGPIADDGRLPLKVLFFDLDETLLTSTDPSVNAGSLDGLSFLGQVPWAADPSQNVDVIVNRGIVKLLRECTNQDHVKWYIISAGHNLEKLEVMLAKCGPSVVPDNQDIGVEIFGHDGKSGSNNKRNAIQGILNKLESQFMISEALFIDDTQKNINDVAKISKIRGVKVPEGRWQADWLDITLMTNKNIADCFYYIKSGMGMGALKKTKRKGKKSSKPKGKKSSKPKGKKSSKPKGKKSPKPKGKKSSKSTNL